MASCKDLTGQKKNILVYGPTGSGKTQLFATIPGKKLIYMFDHAGLDTLTGLDIDYEYFPPEAPLGISRTKHGSVDRRGPKQTEPMAYANFEDHVEAMIAQDFEGYDVVGFDSITTLQIMVMDRVLYINSRYGQAPEISDYNIVGDTILKIFRTVMSCSPLIYVTGHSDLVQDNVSKKVQNQFDTIKNIKRLLPRITTDVWISGVSGQGDKGKYTIQTMPSQEWPAAKNSMKLKYTEDVTLDFNKNLEEQGVGRFLKEAVNKKPKT
jgi:hypothetical protein